MPNYCGLTQRVLTNGIITVEATITTNANPIEPDDSDANSNAWVGASNGLAGNAAKWAQIGYLYRRDVHGHMSRNIYVEVQAGPHDPTDYYVQYFNGPAAGSHHYSAVLDEIDGTWNFFFDGSFLSSFQHNGWKNLTGRRATFTCESNGEEADVLGTRDDPCNFTNCSYEIATADPHHPQIVNPNFTDAHTWTVLDHHAGNGVGTVTLNAHPSNTFGVYFNEDAVVEGHARVRPAQSHIPPAEQVALLETVERARLTLTSMLLRNELSGVPIILTAINRESGRLQIVIEQSQFRRLGAMRTQLRNAIGDVPFDLVPGHLHEQNGGAGGQKIRPLVGGIQLQTSLGKSTSAICAYRKQTGRLGILTCGHAIEDQYSIVYQPDSSNLVGLVDVNLYARNIDAGFVNISAGIPATVFQVWTASGGYAVTGILLTDPVQGSSCEVQGAQSGTLTGVISSHINITVMKGTHAINGVTLATYIGADGDSGAPVVQKSGATVTLIGVHCGLVTMASTNYSYFTQCSTFHADIELVTKVG